MASDVTRLNSEVPRSDPIGQETTLHAIQTRGNADDV